MPFSDADRAILLAVKGVGPGVVQRLEEYGISDLKSLALQEASALCSEISQRLGSTCWRNSPLARKALEGANEAARRKLRKLYGCALGLALPACLNVLGIGDAIWHFWI